MEQNTIYFFIILSLSIAFGGIKYSFDRIYGKNFQEKIKKYEGDIEKNLYFSLRELAFKSLDLLKYKDEIDKKVKIFIDNYTNYHDTIKGSYKYLLSDRNRFTIAFFFTSFFYIVALINQNFSIFGTPILSWANFLLILSFILLGVFLIHFLKLQTRIAKHHFEKPTFQETVNWILNKVFKKK